MFALTSYAKVHSVCTTAYKEVLQKQLKVTGDSEQPVSEPSAIAIAILLLPWNKHKGGAGGGAEVLCFCFPGSESQSEIVLLGRVGLVLCHCLALYHTGTFSQGNSDSARHLKQQLWFVSCIIE